LPSRAIDFASPAFVYFDARERVVEVARLFVDVARLQAEVDAALSAFDVE
jgi:hypothetical protein